MDRSPTLVNVYETFGPTHPGEYDVNNGIYSLHYPGLSFSFPIPKKFEKLFSTKNEIPPMEFPDRTTPVTSRIYLFNGQDSKHPEIPNISSSLKNYYFEQVNASVSEGIYFCERKCLLNFKSTTQDVLSTLGSPSRVFYKTEDKMKIHTSSSNGNNQSFNQSFFTFHFLHFMILIIIIILIIVIIINVYRIRM